MIPLRERFAALASDARAALAGLRRDRTLWLAVAAGGFFSAEAARQEYPAAYIFVPDLSILPVQLAQWAWLLARGFAVAAAFAVPIALFAREERDTAREPSRLETALILAGVTALAFFLRTFWADLIPPAPWVDGILAIDGAATAGRFLGPHEALPMVGDPGLAAPPSPEAVRLGIPTLFFGYYLDVVRLMLLLFRDRHTAVAMLSALPASLLPAALWAAARRAVPARAALWAAFLCAVTPWPTILGRWGWVQQLMSVMVLLILERATAGLEERRWGAVLTAGVLAGLTCETYIAGMIAAAAIGAWILLETRRAREALLYAAGAALTVIPQLLVYREYRMGGRLASAVVQGGVGRRLAAIAFNTYAYVGEFFFTPDGNPRHGRFLEPHQSPLLVALVLVGLAVLSRKRALSLPLRGLLVVFLTSLAGGVLSETNLSPNGFRTGLAGVVILVAAGAGFGAVVAWRGFSAGFRLLAPALLALVFFSGGVLTLLGWAFAPITERYFGDAARIGRFAEIAGPSRVIVDRRIFYWGHPTYHASAFEIGADHPLEPLRPLRYEVPPAAGLAALDADWFVTYREPASLPGMDLAAPGHQFAGLRAVNLKRLRERTPAPASARPGTPPR